MTTYYTVVIPFSEKPTEWHPAEKTGPFSTLTRGAFPFAYHAHQWAKVKLEGQPYSVKWVTP